MRSGRRHGLGRTIGIRYRRLTVCLTDEQHRWAKRVAGAAVEKGIPVSASDVVRLALEQLRTQERNLADLRQALVAQAWAEAEPCDHQ